jgi:alpha-L-fucosidase
LWYPAECDGRLESTWFWHPHQPPKSLAALITMYDTSVGRNCQLILDTPPDKSGRLDAADVARLDEFGAWIRRHAAHDLARGQQARHVGNDSVIFSLAQPIRFRTLGFAEDIRRGQRVEAFDVALDDGSGRWKPLLVGQTIGYKRLLPLDRSHLAKRVRLHIRAQRAPVGPLTLLLYR